MKLPVEFSDKMKKLLADDYADFEASYSSAAYKSLRINPLKMIPSLYDETLSKLDGILENVPWCADGYYYDEDLFMAGKHILHEAGAYYIQEASAMSSAEYIGAKSNEYILDLCAAPGGKATQIASKMMGQGVLIANEPVPSRAKTLSSNIERMGIINAYVLNETPAHLSEKFHGFFDRIMVDAPCSGEGMFRKNYEATLQWSNDNVQMCAKRQDEILDEAAKMLLPGGTILYSTCTFSPEEDEGSVTRFLNRHPDFYIEHTDLYPGMNNCIPSWYEGSPKEISNAIRIFPHKAQGEGHFLCVLKKEGLLPPTRCAHPTVQRLKDSLYLLPDSDIDLKGLKCVKTGLHLGVFKKGRFEPSHSLAMASNMIDAADILKELIDIKPPVEVDASCAIKFIAGESLPCTSSIENGWHIITHQKLPLGWGKYSNGIIKNHYPKGLRKNVI